MFDINLKLLKTIIDDNKNTEYGKKYNFSEIKTIDEYRKRVPLNNYDDYVEYIKKMYDGEKNILTSYPIIGYLCHIRLRKLLSEKNSIYIKSFKKYWQ